MFVPNVLGSLTEIWERERRRVRACSFCRSPHVLLSLTCSEGSKLLLAACRQHIKRKSRLHENEIYECEFCTSNSSRIIKTSSWWSVTSVHSITAVVMRFFARPFANLKWMSHWPQRFSKNDWKFYQNRNPGLNGKSWKNQTIADFFFVFVFIIIGIVVPKDETKCKWFISCCARV